MARQNRKVDERYSDIEAIAASTRKLSPLERAKCLRWLRDNPAPSDLRRIIEKQVGNMLRRNINRYLAVLRTPLAVQQAFDAGLIPLVVADRVMSLQEDERAEVAERLAAGEAIEEIAKDYPKLAASTRRSVAENAKNAFGRLVRAMMRETPRVRANLDRIPSIRPGGNVDMALHDMADLITTLLSRPVPKADDAALLSPQLITEILSGRRPKHAA